MFCYQNGKKIFKYAIPVFLANTSPKIFAYHTSPSDVNKQMLTVFVHSPNNQLTKMASNSAMVSGLSY